MAVKLHRPILITGVGLSVALWLWDSAQGVIAEVGGFSVLSLALAGAGWWVWQRRTPTAPGLMASAPLDRAGTEQLINDVDGLYQQLQGELTQATGSEISLNLQALSQASQSLGHRLGSLRQDLDRQTLTLGIVGNQGAGKTTLLQALSHGGFPDWSSGGVQLYEYATVSPTEIETHQEGESPVEVMAKQLRGMDGVVLLVTGDLTQSDYTFLHTLKQKGHRVILALNKLDHYTPDEQAQLQYQIRQHLQDVDLDGVDFVTIATQPYPLKVRQYQADGTVIETLEATASTLTPLTDRLSQMAATERQEMILATCQRCAIVLQQEIRSTLNHLRRLRALPIVEQFQWIAAATAFVNPVPTLDLLATTAINAQMVVDLGTIYQQRWSLQQAKPITTALVGQLLQMGLVELSTQALTALLKSNTVTYVAGGLVQGVSAAYLTRVAGLSLIELFETHASTAPEQLSWGDRFAPVLQTVLAKTQQSGLKEFAQQALHHLTNQAVTPCPVRSV